MQKDVQRLMQIRLKRPIGREQIAASIIYCCIAITLLSLLIVDLMGVKVNNVEAVDRGLYTVITEKGPVNVESSDVLRIERTYTKAVVTGTPIETDKIFTTKGFIYAATTDPFYQNVRQLINSVDFEGKEIWEREDITWESVKPYAYAVGTPQAQVSWLFFLLSLQYVVLSIGAIALVILIFPMPWKEVKENNKEKRPGKAQEQDYCNEEQLSSAAK